MTAEAGGESGLADSILREFGGAVILYDGECPVCGEYLNLLKIRELAGEVQLVNARTRPDLVEGLRAAGYEINDAGFQGTADHRVVNLSTSRRWLQPGKTFRFA